MIRRSIVILSVFAVVAAACSSDEGEPASPTPSSPSATPTPSATASPPVQALTIPGALVLFAEMTDVPLLGRDAEPYAGPKTPRSLEGVSMSSQVQEILADKRVRRALEANGFVVVPQDYLLFHFAYQNNVYDGWPVFVTTDVAYHLWHLAFDKVLRSLEQEVLLPELETLVSGLLQAAHAQAQRARGTDVEEAASRIEQLFQVTAAELGQPVSLGPLARREKALIDAHSEATDSPLVGGKIDYSLFTPRGHYTRNADLTRYFVAMSVLGNLAFCLPGSSECPGLEPTRMAILASRVLTADDALLERWRLIYEPTAFLVGLADDYTPAEVRDAARDVTPRGLRDAEAFGDDALVEDVVAALTRIRPIRINPDHGSIRLMGARFVLDAFILDQLIYPNVGTPGDERLLPSALDVAAAFGSGFAYDVLDDMGETAYEHYDSQLRLMREAVAARPAEDWGGTVYDAWLHALEPEFVDHGKAFPDFMRTRAWAAKAHQSALGSYAELKHDTILYAKQALGEGGDGVPIPERRNWVEPEPVVFGRLAAIAELMRTGLAERDLLTPEQSSLLADLEELFGFFERLARDELSGRPISAADNDRLLYIGEEFEAMWTRTADPSSGGGFDADEEAAIVADIARGGSDILEVATGRIDRILVLVPDDAGNFQIAMGGVYSYYEFTSQERLTDESWRAMLNAGEEPDRPEWEEVLFG
ncbi:MAG TPA: DUF3160 domain-containing protein [Actinomycetota bacterium]|nr:DUF3160 domain-containing protein [Actinomycetota bacterium]